MCFSIYFLCCSMCFCVVLYIACFMSFSVLFVCICVLYYCHRVATQLQLNIFFNLWFRASWFNVNKNHNQNHNTIHRLQNIKRDGKPIQQPKPQIGQAAKRKKNQEKTDNHHQCTQFYTRTVNLTNIKHIVASSWTFLLTL